MGDNIEELGVVGLESRRKTEILKPVHT